MEPAMILQRYETYHCYFVLFTLLCYFIFGIGVLYTCICQRCYGWLVGWCLTALSAQAGYIVP